MNAVLIETPRLYMREFTMDDALAVHEFGSNEEVTRYTGDAGSVESLQDAKKIIEKVWLAEYKKYGYARYALVHKSDDRVIGFCGLKFEEEMGLPDIGYRMLPEYWGRGLATEAARATLEYARTELGLGRIVGLAVVENVASNRVLEKIGMRIVATFEEDGFTINRYESEVVTLSLDDPETSGSTGGL